MTETNSKWLVVVNPMASVGKSGKDWPEIKQILIDQGIDFDDILTEYPRHAIEIVRNAIVEKGYRKFIAVGGDGTNNEVINGIFTQDVVPTNEITMAALPIGTGNDWRRTFDIPLEYDKVAKIIKAGHTYAHDIGKLTYYDDGNTGIVRKFYSSGDYHKSLKEDCGGASAASLGAVPTATVRPSNKR